MPPYLNIIFGNTIPLCRLLIETLGTWEKQVSPYCSVRPRASSSKFVWPAFHVCVNCHSLIVMTSFTVSQLRTSCAKVWSSKAHVSILVAVLGSFCHTLSLRYPRTLSFLVVLDSKGGPPNACLRYPGEVS